MKAACYRRPEKPLTIPAIRREAGQLDKPTTLPALITVDRSTQCFVTPAWAAERAVDYANGDTSHTWLEPQAGTGSLIDAMLNNGIPLANITAVERHYALVSATTTRFEGINIHQVDFLEWAKATEQRFDRIVMNPPYASRDAYRHVTAATGLLNPNGVLIAIVPITFKHDGEDLETLPNDTFTGTNVNTKIIRCQKNGSC